MTLSLLTTEDKQLHTGIYRVEGKFRFNTASDPTSIIGRGISSVSHDSTGVWTVTLDSELQNAQGVVHMQATLELDAAADSHVQVGAFTEAAGTLVVRVHTGGSLADVAAGSNDGNWCHLSIALKFSEAEDGSGLV